MRAAEDMHARQAALDARWAEDGLLPFGLGIGLSTGEVAAAYLGSTERVEYTVVGDVVNLAQRLQDLARPAGTTVASAATLTAAVGVASPPTAGSTSDLARSRAASPRSSPSPATPLPPPRQRAETMSTDIGSTPPTISAAVSVRGARRTFTADLAPVRALRGLDLDIARR